ncbi:MAG: DoxX family protein [Bacteroidia bacterium]
MSKRNKIIYWVATVWLSLGMTATGIGQLIKMKEGAGGLDSMTHLGYPIYILLFLAICKFLGVITLLIPKFPLLKEWAYAGFTFLVIGALYSHIANGDETKELFGPALLLILIACSRYFRPEARKIVF